MIVERAKRFARSLDRRTLIVLFGGAALTALALGASCGRSSVTAGGHVDGGAGAAVASARVDAGLVQVAIAGEDLWSIAEAGEEDDLARLADREGAANLADVGREAKTPAQKRVAIRAMAYTDGFAGLPWLAEVADADDDDAKLAVQSIDALAARRRTSADAEDAEEMRKGCDRLLAVAKNEQRAKAQRIGAIRAIRMWSDPVSGYGCAKPEEIPQGLDAR